MPGGGNLLGASDSIEDYSLNDRGEVAFGGVLDTSTAGLPDSGVYVFAHGKIALVARAGTVIPDVGTLVSVYAVGIGGPVGPPMHPLTTVLSGAAINNRGEVFFEGTLKDGRGVLLLAKPHG